MPKKKNQEEAKVEATMASEISPGQVTLEEAIADAEHNGVNPALISVFRKQAQTLSEQEADELILMAREDTFARWSSWMNYLPGLTYRDRYVLAFVYGFQTRGLEYRMSHAQGADATRIERKNYMGILENLVKQGFLSKHPNGTRKPATYIVAEVFCIRIAQAEGWKPRVTSSKKN